MSDTQTATLSRPPSHPRLAAVPEPATPTPQDILGDAVEAYLKRRGAPPQAATELADTVERAAKKVPAWVIWLIVSLGSPLIMGIYAQYQTYKDLPSRTAAIERRLETQETQLNRIEDLLSPTSRPR